MPPVPALFVFDDDELCILKQLNDGLFTLKHLEAVDASYEGFDSVDQRVTFSAGNDKNRVVTLVPGEVMAAIDTRSPPDPGRLAFRIRSHLHALGHSYDASVPLDELVRHCLTIYSES